MNEEEALFKAIAVNEVDAGRRGERGRGGAIGCKLVERNKGQTQLTSRHSRPSARVTVL